jgi:antitoxin component YwqK of YwqJK toxin-antitoxin module
MLSLMNGKPFPASWLLLRRIAGLLPLFLLAACANGPELETVESTDEQGLRIVYQRQVDNYAREGQFERFDAGGNRIELAGYRNDSLHGPRILFYPTGDTLSVETYRDGRFEGPYRAYFEDGTLRQVGQYADNVMTGPWISYYPSGERREVVQMANNLEQGPFTEWYDGGALKAEGQYRDGDKEDGELRLYDSTGTLVRIMDCELGMCFTRWRADTLQTTTE